MTAPRIARLWDGSVRLTFPYAAELVDALKATVPGYARTYDPATRAWTITPAYAHVAGQLMHDVFPDVEIVGAANPPPFDHGRPAGQKQAQALEAAETAKRQENDDQALAAITDRLRRDFMAQPGATIKDFEAALPELLAEHRKQAVLNAPAVFAQQVAEAKQRIGNLF